MDILLHVCCAPCSLYTIDKLRQDGHKVEGFFYNPNIYPLSEYKLRRQAVVEMAKRLNVNIMYKDDQWQPLGGGSAKTSRNRHRRFRDSEFVVARPDTSCRDTVAAPTNYVLLHPTFVAAKKQRCNNCWRMRLSEASKAARQEGFDAFSTTLLISPYQDHDQIRIMGSELGKEKSVDFYYDDFRVGFRKSQQMAKEQGYYRQKYCGCKFSVEQRGLKSVRAIG